MRLFPLWAVVSLAACGGGGGDAPKDPLADALGDGARLSEILGPAGWLDSGDMTSETCDPPEDRTVRVTGVSIVAIDRFDETGDGALGNFYVEDSSDRPLAYSGVTVFDPSFSPPDLKLAVADVADLSGVYTEFLGPSSGKFGYCRTLPEIGGTMSFRFETTAPPPVVLEANELKTYETARPWLGMLVRVEKLRLTTDAETDSSGRVSAYIDVGGGIPQADVPSISNELFDLTRAGVPLTAGTTFASVTGIVTYFYGFKLAPRSADDFEL